MKKLPWKFAALSSIFIILLILLPFIALVIRGTISIGAFGYSLVNNLLWLKFIIGIGLIFLLLLFYNTKRFSKYFLRSMIVILLTAATVFIIASIDSNFRAQIDKVLNANLFAAGITIYSFVAVLLGLYLNGETKKCQDMKSETNGKPILVENLAGMSGSDIFKLIDRNDKVNRESAVKLISEELKIFDLALRLQYEALGFASSNKNKWTKSDQIVVAMACRVVRQLRAARELMLYGFWAEVHLLERSIHEALTREWYFYRQPQEASKWFIKGSQIKQKEIDEALTEENGGKNAALLETLRNQYGYLSQHTHPNIEAIQLETWDGDDAIGSKGIIAGPINENYFKIQFQSLLVTAATATQVLGIVGFHEATGTWKKEISKLDAKVKKMVNHSKKLHDGQTFRSL